MVFETSLKYRESQTNNPRWNVSVKIYEVLVKIGLKFSIAKLSTVTVNDKAEVDTTPSSISKLLSERSWTMENKWHLKELWQNFESYIVFSKLFLCMVSITQLSSQGKTNKIIIEHFTR